MKCILKNQNGQGLTEYLILVLLIAVVSIGAAKSLGTTIKTKIKEAQGQINSKVILDSKDEGSDDGSSGFDLGRILKGNH
jgi:Flp pilus assembly pilin Flp